MPNDHLYFCDLDRLLPELGMHNGAVMLSEALQRNAKHEARLFQHLCSLAIRGWPADHQRLKAWPRGLRPLRCSFAKPVLSEAEGLRMTFTDVGRK